MKKITIYKIIGGVVALLVVKSIFTGNKEAPVVAAPARTAKIVETQIVGKGEFSEKIHVTGRIAPIREVTVSTQGTGFIGSIPVEAGDTVGSGQILATLADTYGLSGNSIDEAALGISSAELTQESSLSNLDQALESARIAYDKAQKDYADVQRGNTTDASKADLEWQNYLAIQEKTLEGYESTYQSQLQSFQSFLANVIDTGDTLLGVSEQNREGNNSFEYLIAAKDSAKKELADKALNALLPYKNWSPDPALPLVSRVNEMQKVYKLVNTFLTAVETALIQSAPGGADFTQDIINGYRSTIDAYQTQYSSISASLVAFLNSAQTFLATYDRDRLSHEKTAQTAERNAKSTLDLAKKAFETAQKARDIGERQASQGLSIAGIRLQNAQGNAARLLVTAPFSGVVMTKNIEIGSLAVPGANLFTLGDTSRLIAKADIGIDQKKYLKVGQTITLDFDGEMMTGKLTSLSAGPDPKTNLYKIEVTLPIARPEIVLGDIVDILLPGAPAAKQPENQPIVIPFSALKYLGEDTYAVSVMTVENVEAQTGTVHERIVKIGSMNEDSVTIVDGLKEGERIVVRGGLSIDDGDTVQEAPTQETENETTVN